MFDVPEAGCQRLAGAEMDKEQKYLALRCMIDDTPLIATTGGIGGVLDNRHRMSLKNQIEDLAGGENFCLTSLVHGGGCKWQQIFCPTRFHDPEDEYYWWCLACRRSDDWLRSIGIVGKGDNVIYLYADIDPKTNIVTALREMPMPILL